jgi:protein SCO1
MIGLGVTSVGLLIYFRHQRKKHLERLNSSGTLGVPSLGGPFTLTTHLDTKFDSEKDAIGKYQLVYFGFTHCPDICPEELEKMSKVLTGLEELKENELIIPLFITCDPKRDGPKELAFYLKGIKFRFNVRFSPANYWIDRK